MGEEIEIWRDVINWEGFYKVSSFGRVKSILRKHVAVEKFLKPKIDRYGYLCVTLRNGKINSYSTIHRLVALAFIPLVENKNQVNHINGDKTNNRISNLEWVSCKENIRHAISNGFTKIIGVENHRAILTNNEVIDIKILLKAGYKTSKISKFLNIPASRINDIKTKNGWKHIQI